MSVSLSAVQFLCVLTSPTIYCKDSNCSIAQYDLYNVWRLGSVGRYPAVGIFSCIFFQNFMFCLCMKNIQESFLYISWTWIFFLNYREITYIFFEMFCLLCDSTKHLLVLYIYIIFYLYVCYQYLKTNCFKLCLN